MKLLTDTELSDLPPAKVYNIFAFVRARLNSMYPTDDGEPVSNDYWKEIEEIENYMDRLRHQLLVRPFKKLTKAEKALQQKEKLAGLKGNRRRR